MMSRTPHSSVSCCCCFHQSQFLLFSLLSLPLHFFYCNHNFCSVFIVVQINKVDCAPEEGTRFLAPSVSEQIQKYYRAHHVKVFTFSRPFHRGHRDPNNEFATLCIEKTTLHTAYALPGMCYICALVTISLALLTLH